MTGISYGNLKRINICIFFFFSLVGLVFFPINTYRTSNIRQRIFVFLLNQVLACCSSFSWTVHLMFSLRYPVQILT